MKTIWSIVTILALANMMAFVGFVGWLGGTGRLSPERFREIRSILAPTVAEAAAAQAEVDAAEAADAEAAAEAERTANPPLTPTAVLARREVALDASAQAVQRIRQEVSERQAELQRQVDALATARAEFEAERTAWEDEREATAARASDEQFTKLVGLFGALKPKDATALLKEMEAVGEREEVVRLLDALPTRTTAKIIAELKTPEDRTLASALLGRLRDLGRELPGIETPVEPSADVDPLEQPDG